MNGPSFYVTDLTTVGNYERRPNETFPRKEDLVRPRLKNVISKMRRERNSASEEALAKSRGNKAYRSWRDKKAKAARDCERKEEEYEAPKEPASSDSNTYNFPSFSTSPHETQSAEDITEDLRPISDHSEPGNKKRTRNAYPEMSQKRRKAASEPNAAEEFTAAAQRDNNHKSEAHRGSGLRGARLSPIVEIIAKAPSEDSLYREDNFATVPSLLKDMARNKSPENDAAIREIETDIRGIQEQTNSSVARASVSTDSADVQKVENLKEFDETLEFDSSPPKLVTSPKSAYFGSAKDSAVDAQYVQHKVIQSPASSNHGPLEHSSNFASLNAQTGSSTHDEHEMLAFRISDAPPGLVDSEIVSTANMALQADQPPQAQIATPSKRLTAKTTPISLDSDSEDDIEIIAVKPSLKKARSELPRSSPKYRKSNKPDQPPMSHSAILPRTNQTTASPAETPSQGRRKGPPGLRELPGTYPRIGGAPSVIEADSSTRQPVTPGKPLQRPSLARQDGRKGPPGLKALLSTTKFTPALVGRLLNTKPGPILVDEDLEEETTSAESSPELGTARMQIEVGATETKITHQKALPIAISSDEDSDQDSPIRMHRRTVSDFRLQNRNNMAKRAQTAIAAERPSSSQERLQTSNPRRESKTSKETVEQQEWWPKESRGELAQAAIDYLNAVPDNKQLPTNLIEMLNLLDEQPEFDKLCSQIKQSGRTLVNSDFASAILSKLEPQMIEEPSNENSPCRIETSTTVKQFSNISRKMTPGRAVDKPVSTPLSKTPVKSITKPPVSAETPRSTSARAPDSSPQVISLVSPAPISSKAILLDQASSRQKTTRIASNRNATPISASHKVIVLDFPALSSIYKPLFAPIPAPHRQARENEVLDHIAERLLLHEGLEMLPKIIKFTTAQVAEEEYNLFNAENAVEKREKEKTNRGSEKMPKVSKVVRHPDFSVYKRFADGADRVEETPDESDTSNFHWTWRKPRDIGSPRKIRGRSTSVVLPSECPVQTSSEGRALLLTPQKTRGRSTTPEVWLTPLVQGHTTETSNGTKSMNVESEIGEGTESNDDFFDAEEGLSRTNIDYVDPKRAD